MGGASRRRVWLPDVKYNCLLWPSDHVFVVTDFAKLLDSVIRAYNQTSMAIRGKRNFALNPEIGFFKTW